jgi:hypothetical protein
MNYSYDYLQARVADLYDEADHQRRLNAARRRSGRGRWPVFVRRRRLEGELGGCRD